MEQMYFSVSNSRSASQEIPHLLWHVKYLSLWSQERFKYPGPVYVPEVKKSLIGLKQLFAMFKL
jgi:hypothetical protein